MGHRCWPEWNSPSAAAKIPGYEILGELGRGGMGVVWKARQIKAGRLVALKCLLDGALASTGEIARFAVEARAAARLEHPNIVPVYDVGEHQGHHYFTMKLVTGGSLVSRGASPMTRRRAARLLEAVAQALHAVHDQQGDSHHGLKPLSPSLLLYPKTDHARKGRTCTKR